MYRQLPALPSLTQQRHLAKDLCKAWKRGDLEALQRLRDQHPRPQKAAGDGIAPYRFRLSDAQLVLAREYGFACWNDLKQRIELLVGTRESKRIVVFARAVAAGDHLLVQRMLKRDPELARTDIAPTNEHRGLHFAVRNRDVEMVRLLLEAGGDPNQGVYPWREPTTPRALAEDRGYGEIVTQFVQEDERRRNEAPKPASVTSAAPIGGRDAATAASTGMPLDTISLETAIAAGDALVVRQCAERDPNRFAPNIARRCGLLQIAVTRDRLDMLTLLMDLGCDPDDRHRVPNLEEELFTQGEPLWIAAGEGQYDHARVLLERGAKPNAQLYASGDAVSRAYNNRDRKMIDLLVAHGGVIDLITAVLEGDESVARPLLSVKAVLDPTVLGHAICGGNSAIVRLCLDRTPPSEANSYELLSSAMRLWRCGPYRKHRDFDKRKYLEIMRLLLDRGANPNAKGRWGYTPLHETVRVGHAWGETECTPEDRVAFAELLLERGAKLDVLDDELLSTPLGWAARCGKTDLVELFLKHGARINLPDDEAWATPLAWAGRKGHADVVALLRKHGATR